MNSSESVKVINGEINRTKGNTNFHKLGQILIERGDITEKELAIALSQQSGIPYVDLNKHAIQPDALKLVPEPMAKKYNIIPLSIHDSSIEIAMADPNDLDQLDALRINVGMRILPMIATTTDIQEAIVRNYSSYHEIEKQFKGNSAPKVNEKSKDLNGSIANAPAVRALDLIIHEALKSRASDVHIEPEEDRVRVRYRIDGVMHECVFLPYSAHAPLLSRVKVLGNMDIGDHRPQDGQFSVQANGKEVDVRVATIATAYGEMATLRLLDKSFALRRLDELGFTAENLSQYEKMIRSPFGMLLVSGPTGSGKTTTLYASLNSLDRKAKNIITVEDPIEYHLDGINQIQVNPRAKLTFSAGLRSIMRHDPDVILVGEIRDTDTAAIAIQAANTGHLVLASVHANDTIGVLLRLIDLGIESFLVASALIGIVAQRMVRRVCPYCQHEAEAPIMERQAYFSELGEERGKFLYGAGCNRCSNSGYLGRIAVFEVLCMTDEIRRLVSSGASAQQIREKAREEGLSSMWRDGMLKVKAGITTPSDVMQNIFSLG